MAIQKTTEKSRSTLASPVRILTQQLELPPCLHLLLESKGTPHQGQQHGQPSTQLCPVQRSTNTTAVKAERHCPEHRRGVRSGTVGEHRRGVGQGILRTLVFTAHVTQRTHRSKKESLPAIDISPKKTELARVHERRLPPHS